MLAYPSTELGKQNKDNELQKRIVFDLPFLKEGISFTGVIELVRGLPINSGERSTVLSLRTDFIHCLDGILKYDEIKEKLKLLYLDHNLIPYSTVIHDSNTTSSHSV